MRHRVTVIGVIVTALSTLAFAQRGLSVVVSLEIHSRAPGYSGRAEQAPVKSSYGHMPVFFQGSAPRIVVRIRNYTSRRVALGRAGRSWSDDLDLTIAHTSRRSSEGRVLVRRAARKTALEAGGDDDFLSFELISTSTGQLPPGRYRVDRGDQDRGAPAAVSAARRLARPARPPGGTGPRNAGGYAPIARDTV